MTILTKPSNEKKAEKIPLPLGIVTNEDGSLLQPLPSAPAIQTTPLHHDGDAESMVFNRQHFSLTKTLLVFLGSLVVMLMGVVGGYTLYRMYAPLRGNLHFRGMCDIPYSSSSRSNVTSASRLYSPDIVQLYNDLRNLFPQLNSTLEDDDFFREEIELDLTDEESFSKIDVPDFKDGRRGRFMHDFKENQSAIIDTTANRCFIMPLDRDTTLAPRSFLDLMQKMGSGYYNIDTDRVRKNMRVVTPEIKDMSLISQRIANECYDMKVYLLENYVSGVFKREAKIITDAGKFAEFSGKGIVEFDLMNIADIEKYELEQKK